MAKKNELTHLAIILDGNGRWAQQHGLERVEGHKAGAENVLKLIETLDDFPSIRYLTLYAFSTENWNRSQEEVDALMELFCQFLDHYSGLLLEKKVRLLITGQRERMPQKCLERMDKVTALTSKDYKKTVIFAINYGGRQEIMDAVRKIAEKISSGSLTVDAVDEAQISANLYHPDVPDPDLMVRTSGELRISNFLLWQISYSELYFTDTLWPDFDKT